jgi:hypothetical protein
MNPRILASICVALWIAACSNNAPVDDSGKVTCGAGQKTAYHTDTGKPYCVDISDGGNLDDGISGDNDTGGVTPGKDSTVGKDSTLGNKDDGDAGSEEDILSGQAGCPAAATVTGAGKTGTACTADGDCLYGHCKFGMPLAGYDAAIGYCTRMCGCPTACNGDDGGNVGYGCAIEKTANGGNPKRSGDNDPLKYCARGCKTDSECKAWNPAMPDCIKASTNYITVSTIGACGKNPLK